MGAIPGSREPSPSSTGLDPSGFDPERMREVQEILAREKWLDSYQVHLALCFIRDHRLAAEFAYYLEKVAAVENGDD